MLESGNRAFGLVHIYGKIYRYLLCLSCVTIMRDDLNSVLSSEENEVLEALSFQCFLISDEFESRLVTWMNKIC